MAAVAPIALVGRSAPAIEDHAAIGDGRSVALTDGRGAIDWLAWPRFDSDPVFASLLDEERGGVFRVAPVGEQCASVRYLEDTNVAVTRFERRGAVVELLDLMSIDDDGGRQRSFGPQHELLRVVSCVAGAALVLVELDPRLRFGLESARMKVDRRGGVRFEDRGALYQLRASRELVWRRTPRGALEAHFALRLGERVALSLTYARDVPAVVTPLADAGAATVEATTTSWRRWAAKARWDGPNRAVVVRNALALKLLCYAPSGAIIAAPTTSLPETRGGAQNWDYRFCWLRDASFTVRALFGLGFDDEARAFASWLVHATRLTRPALRMLYDVFGERPRDERELPWLTGWGGARPVRTGNAASDQLQLDVYGEVIDAVAQACRNGRDGSTDPETLEMLREFAAYVAEHAREPDHGIWEPREGPRHHTHSRVLSWVALDRVLCLADEGLLPLSAAERSRFGVEREGLAAEVRTRAWSRELGAYVSELGGDRLDASTLLLSWYGFEDASSPRMRGTFDAIERVLAIGDDLLLRNEALPDDGGFVACAFWAVDHMARGGRTLGEARARFERLLALASPTGLWAEIVEPKTRAHLGNYPQGFSHLAVVNAALSLAERERRERVG